MIKIITAVVLLAIVGIGLFVFINSPKDHMENKDTIRYIPIGDSYTIGYGVPFEDSFPSLLTTHLQEVGIPIQLVVNPAVSGFTIQDAITYELSVLEEKQGEFTTVLLGANDLFQGRSADDAFSDFKILLDKIESVISDKKNIIVLTVPDFLSSPSAASYKDTSYVERVEQYNTLIAKEAKRRGFKVVDLYSATHNMESKSDYFVSDGLHPSRTQYVFWETLLFPVVKTLLE